MGRVHRIFIEKLEKKIELLQNMEQLNLLLDLLKQFKILNRLVIRMKLLRNISLLETEKWREAVHIIMKIVWKHARIDEDNADMLQHCTAELLFNLLKRENQREFGLKLFLANIDKLSFLITNETEMDDEEEDLYASSDNDNAPILGLDNDDDTNLAIALSESQAAANNNGEEKEKGDESKDDEKEPPISKEKDIEMMDIEKGKKNNAPSKHLDVVPENEEKGDEKKNDDMEEHKD